MRVIAVIDYPRVTEKILRHLGAWHAPPARPPPQGVRGPYTYEPCDDSNSHVTVQVLEVKNAWSYCVELWSNSGMSLSVEGSPFCDFLKEGSGWPVL